MGHQKRAANLLLNMPDVARKVCMSVGKDVIGNVAGAAHILRILRERVASDAIDSIFQDMVKAMDTYPMEFDVLRRKAEARMLMRSGYPDEFVSVL